jgi:hypothetical protein
MHNGPLIRAAADKVHAHRDKRNHPEHAPRAERLRVGVHDAACVTRPPFEEVRALVDGGDEGYGALAERVGFAEERDDCGLAAFGFFRGLLAV